MSNWYITPSNDDLQHHGILGMHWGVRRYQNKDGSYTSAGKKRYGIEGERSTKQLSDAMTDYTTAKEIAKYNHDYYYKRLNKGFSSKILNSKLGKKTKKEYEGYIEKYKDVMSKADEQIEKFRKEAENKGYKITEKQVLKNVNTGADYAMLAASLALNAITIPTSGIVYIPIGQMLALGKALTFEGNKVIVNNEETKNN